MDRESYGSGFLGFLSGLATGAILGILYAPKSGLETRQLILEKGNAAVNDVKTSITNASEAIQTKAVDLKTKVTDLTAGTEANLKTIDELNAKVVELEAQIAALNTAKPKSRSR